MYQLKYLFLLPLNIYFLFIRYFYYIIIYG